MVKGMVSEARHRTRFCLCDLGSFTLCLSFPVFKWGCGEDLSFNVREVPGTVASVQ